MPRKRKPINNIAGMTSCSSPALGFVVRLSATYKAKTMIANVGMKANAIRRGAYQVTSPFSHHCMGRRRSPENRVLARSASHIITAAKADPIVTSAIVQSPSAVFSFLWLRPQLGRILIVRFARSSSRKLPFRNRPSCRRSEGGDGRLKAASVKGL